MAIRVYNTLARKKEVFKPIKDKEVGMYTCGPTVYWYQHIGNLRSYIFPDILRRVLAYNGFKVKQVINVTDVGHLTSDADTGEDKIERAAKREGKTAKQIADYYLKIFQSDLKKINVLDPSIWTKATEHVKEQITLIKKLEEKGYTYRTNDGIYFDTSKFKDYGKLAGLKKEGIKAGKRITIGEKKHNTDFALWKFSEQPSLRLQEWYSPWGLGFPGWHIECSAMSMKYLGKHFDIHTGGQDHIQIHHTNEIAQSEAATGKKFVNYWVHGAWLLFEGRKVSKSSGGLYTISELEKKGFEPLDFRYLCLTTHYRKPLSFTFEKLSSARDSYTKLKKITLEIRDEFVHNLNSDESLNSKYLSEFGKFVNNDLNTPGALHVLWNFVHDSKARGKYKTVEKMDSVLGLNLLNIEITKEIERLKKERDKARKEGNFKKADELRDQINAKGFYIDDTPRGSFISGTGPLKI